MIAKIGLVLGSGGLRGLAHVGVIRVLEREKISIDYIAGCSIGSMIGALYSSGHDTETIIKLAKHLKPRYWLDFVIPKMGIISGDRVLDTIRLLTKRKSFADLDIPLAIVATEIISGKEIIFTEGDIANAVRASVSVPGIFVPFAYNGMLLVDGAVLNATPIDVARQMGAEIVIAVDLAHAGTVGNITNMFDVVIQSIDIMERELFKHRHSCRGDILIRPEVKHISPSSFDSIDECVALGEQAAMEAIPDIRRVLAEYQWGCKQESVDSPFLPGSMEMLADLERKDH